MIFVQLIQSLLVLAAAFAIVVELRRRRVSLSGRPRFADPSAHGPQNKFEIEVHNLQTDVALPALALDLSAADAKVRAIAGPHFHDLAIYQSTSGTQIVIPTVPP